jgi:hypothetical protein
LMRRHRRSHATQSPPPRDRRSPPPPPPQRQSPTCGAAQSTAQTAVESLDRPYLERAPPPARATGPKVPLATRPTEPAVPLTNRCIKASPIARDRTR